MGAREAGARESAAVDAIAPAARGCGAGRDARRGRTPTGGRRHGASAPRHRPAAARRAGTGAGDRAGCRHGHHATRSVRSAADRGSRQHGRRRASRRARSYRCARGGAAHATEPIGPAGCAIRARQLRHDERRPSPAAAHCAWRTTSASDCVRGSPTRRLRHAEQRKRRYARRHAGDRATRRQATAGWRDGRCLRHRHGTDRSSKKGQAWRRRPGSRIREHHANDERPADGRRAAHRSASG